MSHTLIIINTEYVTTDRVITELSTRSCFNACMKYINFDLRSYMSWKILCVTPGGNSRISIYKVNVKNGN